jgi:hypothetical protein
MMFTGPIARDACRSQADAKPHEMLTAANTLTQSAKRCTTPPTELKLIQHAELLPSFSIFLA